MDTKGIIFTPGMAEYLMRFPPHLRGMYMLALYRYCFCGAYKEKKPSWCREWLDLAEAEQEGKEIRNKKRRTLKEAEYRQILSYLNDKTGRDFRITDTFRDRVDARIREGAHVEDFMLVIDNTVSAWAGDEKMRRYLRPETLFGSRFDTYRNDGKGGTFAESSFETDDMFAAALRKSYGEDLG
jgi:uncharacterized phage protein (TIGR02220 family)